jgi:diaminopimelate epimerase
MKFYKVHGLGNDFVLFDGRDRDDIDWTALTVKVCDRHTGVGADGFPCHDKAQIRNLRLNIQKV